MFHLGGWILYTFFMYFVFSKQKQNDFKGYFLFFISYLIGFLVTFGLRYFYSYLRKKVISLSKLLILLPLIVIATSILWQFIDVGLSQFFWEDDKKEYYFKGFLTLKGIFKFCFTNSMIVGIWSALYFGMKNWIESQQHKEKAEKATLLAQQAQLQMLRYQLNPHFLFNSLNSIRALIEEDKNSAKEMVTELSEFLRYSLILEDTHFKTVEEEIKAIKHYFAIEKKRFEEKLHVDFNISENTKALEIPGFLIHPLVENAVKYGMKTSAMPLQISISSKLEEGKLIIEVYNSGKWIEPDDPNKFELKGTGRGLNNVRQRLQNTFPGRYNFILITKETGITAKIEIQLNN